MNKAKQIQENGKELYNDLSSIMSEEYEKHNLITPSFCTNKLLDLGYCKLLKDSIIISQQEYDALKTIEAYHIKSCGKNSVVLSIEEYEKYQNLKRDVEYSFEYNQGYTDGQIKGSKETAKEFYDKFNENICYFELENKSKDYKNGYTQAIADICGKLDETAIELGVDLKEYYGK